MFIYSASIIILCFALWFVTGYMMAFITHITQGYFVATEAQKRFPLCVSDI